MRCSAALLLLFIGYSYTKPVPDAAAGATPSPLKAFVASVPECQSLLSGDHTIPNCNPEVSQCFNDAFKQAFQCMETVIGSSDHKPCFKDQTVRDKAKALIGTACNFRVAVKQCMEGTSAPTDAKYSSFLAATDVEAIDRTTHTLPHPEIHAKHTCMQQTHDAIKKCVEDGEAKCTNYKQCIGHEKPTDLTSNQGQWFKVTVGLQHQKHDNMKAVADAFKTCAASPATTGAPGSSESSEEKPQADEPDDSSSEEEKMMADDTDASSQSEDDDDKMMRDAATDSSSESADNMDKMFNDPPSETHDHNSDDEDDDNEDED